MVFLSLRKARVLIHDTIVLAWMVSLFRQQRNMCTCSYTNPLATSVPHMIHRDARLLWICYHLRYAICASIPLVALTATVAAYSCSPTMVISRCSSLIHVTPWRNATRRLCKGILSPQPYRPYAMASPLPRMMVPVILARPPRLASCDMQVTIHGSL